MIASGIDEERAFAHFKEWAEEDAYFPLEEELARDAGGRLRRSDCVWREGGMTIVTARRSGAAPRAAP